MNAKSNNEQKKDHILGSRDCKKCSCPSFRGDSGNPEKCVNIQPPSQKLCGHTKSQHN